MEWVKSISVSTHITLAMLIRLMLIAYGQHQDETMEVKYTDVDYKVFTDAARHVYDGGSPYSRHTYRYSPLLAYLMLPNITWSPNVGKLLFVLFDIFAGYLIYNIVKNDVEAQENRARLASCMWLYNPLVMNVSTRGSAESVIVALVLLTIHLYQQKVFILTGLMYGLAIHMKIYPIIYCLSLYLPLTNETGWRSLFQVTTPRLRLVTSTLVSLIILTLTFYHLYGDEFLEHTYLYHITRKDIRHNFSVYFYLLYLTVEYDDIGLNLVTFLPQVILLLVVSFRFTRLHDVNFAMFCQTLIFVTFNKVVTAQYFIWYFSLLPLILPSLSFSKKDLLLGMMLWGFAQSSWLLPAYMLEFKGNNTFLFIWLEGLAFFCANVGILAKIIRRYREKSSQIEEKCNLHKLD